MPHYEISYAELLEKDPMAAERAAIIDAIRYDRSGVKKTLRLIRAGEIESVEQLAWLLGMFRGIEGYPVKALWDYARRER